MDTIFAPATAPGKSGVAVIRVSGPDAFLACQALTGWTPSERQFRLIAVRDVDGAVIDRGLVLAFVAGHSFTGEDVVEFQLHGSTAVIGKVLARLGAHPGLRPAEAGEFTRRALENNRLDLTQVEGLADLIDAETEQQRRQAMAVFDGVVRTRLDNWRKSLTRGLALVEASIDFAEEDVPENVLPETQGLVASVLLEMDQEMRGVQIAERLRDGFEVAIIGQPNAGKSTLLNRLAGRDVAIASEIPGTTRDVLEISMDLNGLPVKFLDTAGLREAVDAIESIGVSRAIARASQADLRVFLRVTENESWPVDRQAGDMVLWAKSDAGARTGPGISGVTGQGVPEMLAEICDVLTRRVGRVQTMTRQRHAVSIRDASAHLRQAIQSIGLGETGLEYVAEDLRRALASLDELVGQVGVEDILDEIFSSFCIGK